MAKYLDYEGLKYLITKFKALIATVGNYTINGKKISTNPTITKSDIGLGSLTDDAQVKRTEMGVANGVATLGSDGKVPSTQLPSYVDDVLEYTSKSSFPSTGETGKIYIAKDTNLTYRWSGSAYVEISQSLALGETSSTAYAGDKGKSTTDKLKNLVNALQTDIASDGSYTYAPVVGVGITYPTDNNGLSLEETRAKLNRTTGELIDYDSQYVKIPLADPDGGGFTDCGLVTGTERKKIQDITNISNTDIDTAFS